MRRIILVGLFALTFPRPAAAVDVSQCAALADEHASLNCYNIAEAEAERRGDTDAQSWIKQLRAVAISTWAQKHRDDAETETRRRREDDPQRVPFEFKADNFGTMFFRVSELHGRPFLPSLLDCQDETDAAPGFCVYRVSYGPGLSLGVANARGTDKPDKVFVSWNGDLHGAWMLAQVVRTLGYVLSPAVQDGSQEKMANDMLGLIRSYGSNIPDREWTIGTTQYSIVADPHLGDRSEVLFTAVDKRSR